MCCCLFFFFVCVSCQWAVYFGKLLYPSISTEFPVGSVALPFQSDTSPYRELGHPFAPHDHAEPKDRISNQLDISCWKYMESILSVQQEKP